MDEQKYEFGFFRVGLGVPRVNPGNPGHNAGKITGLARTAAAHSVDVLVLPELSVTGYTCADLFYQERLLAASEEAVLSIAKDSSAFALTLIVGAPAAVEGILYNCAVVLRGGSIIGMVPKTYIPNTKEFYEARWFAPGAGCRRDHIRYGGTSVPFGTDLLFGQENAVFGIEICEDLWAPVPPSSYMTQANLIVNLSASNELAGKAAYRRSLVSTQSARNITAYAYVSAGPLESTTDTVFGGHAIIAENGRVLGELPRFSRDSSFMYRDIDLGYLEHERLHSNTFSQHIMTGSGTAAADRRFRVLNAEGEHSSIGFTRQRAGSPWQLSRPVDPHPFVPSDPLNLQERCEEIFAIQRSGLMTRMERIGCDTAVIGLSGGLDSTLALLVTVEAFKGLGLPLSGINCITMPGFGTTGRTLANVKGLAENLGLTLKTIDITEICTLQMKKLGHSGEPEDTAYENVQARERTMILMNKANMNGGIVIGTGDMSELALGWCTYNGDHMSMYGVNAGVPKTLVRFLIKYVADTGADTAVQGILYDIIDTPISPELLPPDTAGNIAQKTEEVIGPYELHDFFLYYGIRCGFAPAKVQFLAEIAFAETYDATTITTWRNLFYARFFSQQFKRSCLPDGPKVGTIALSPRGDWRMPSDGDGTIWKQ
ncbi:MAG: NAD(+) synthase [Spirochaetales bacterium]|nr:NAD(+) synthase [Spirochaetales bacterium]